MSYQKTFKALSEPTRREILMLLRKESMSAGEIASKFKMTNATISHHLSVLKEAEIVIDRRKGKYIIYELNSSVIEDIIVWFLNLKGDEEDEK